MIGFQEGDAATIVLPESQFNSAVCRLGLMFISDLDTAMSNIYRSLVDGGYFAASVWATPNKVPQLAIAMDTINRELKLPIVSQDRSTGPFSLADEKVLKQCFAKCGFKDLDIQRINISFEFISAEEYTNFTKDIAAPVLALLQGQSSYHIHQIWKAVTKATSKYTNKDTKSVILDNEAIRIAGRKN